MCYMSEQVGVSHEGGRNGRESLTLGRTVMGAPRLAGGMLDVAFIA